MMNIRKCSTSNHITNISDKKYLDTIISVGLDELNLEKYIRFSENHCKWGG
jgi:hypothetical protein